MNFQIERAADCHFLVIHGDDDQVYPPEWLQEVARRLSAKGKSNYEIVIYPGAGHLIEPPFSPLTWKSYHASFCKYSKPYFMFDILQSYIKFV